MHHILDLPVVKILFRAPAIVNQLVDGRTGSEEKFFKKTTDLFSSFVHRRKPNLSEA